MGDAFLIQNIKQVLTPGIIAGKHYYLIANHSTLQVLYYQLETPFDLANKGNPTFTLTTSGLPRIDNMDISNDGTLFFLIGANNTNVLKYTLSTPFDLSTASSPTNISSVMLISDHLATCFEFANKGNKFYISNGLNTIIQYNLSTPYDITTRTQSGTLSGFPSGGGDPAFSPDGTKVVIGQRGGSTIRGGTCSTPFDLSTYSQTHTHNTADVDPSCVKWNADGTKFFVRHASPDMVNQHTVSTPYTLQGVSSDQELFVNPSYAAGGHEFNYNY